MSEQVTSETTLQTQEEKDAASAAKYRAQFPNQEGDQNTENNDQGNAKPERPAHIPEKFWDAEKGEVNVEAMAKSYAELEKAKAKAPENTNTEDTRTPEEKLAAEANTAEFGKWRDNLTQKITAGEALTEDDYKPAEKLGFTREDVDTHIEGLKAIAELRTSKVYAEAGGKEKYDDMIAWARGTYAKEEVMAYDRDIHSGDPAVALNAVRGLAARYQLANGTSGRDVTSKGGKSPGEGYESKAQMIADMQNPLYKKDPAFRAEVARKVAGARAAGRDLR